MNRPKDDGGSIYPTPPGRHAACIKEEGCRVSGGMSLRDWFAGQAIPYVCQVAGLNPQPEAKTVFEAIALDAYAMADAMLKTRGPQ